MGRGGGKGESQLKVVCRFPRGNLRSAKPLIRVGGVIKGRELIRGGVMRVE